MVRRVIGFFLPTLAVFISFLVLTSKAYESGKCKSFQLSLHPDHRIALA